MSRSEYNTFVVAGIQMKYDADIGRKGWLNAAIKKIEQAVIHSGAQIIILPEFFPTNYSWSSRIWDDGNVEPIDGPTYHALANAARRFRVYIGTSFLEADSNLDIYNAFILLRPDGTLAGRVRKNAPCSFEAFFIRGGNDDHVIPTEWGDIAVGLCYENHLSLLFNELADRKLNGEHISLIVQPHSVPFATPINGFPKFACDRFDENFLTSSEALAREFQCPAVCVNKVGRFKSTVPLDVASLAGELSFEYRGGTKIVGPNGKVLDEVYGSEEGFARASVLSSYPPVSKEPSSQHVRPGSCGRWNPLLNEPVMAIKILFPVIESIGRMYYTCSICRRIQASRALGKHYNPWPLLPCYVVSILLLIASMLWGVAVSSEHDWENSDMYSAFRDLCVPFLLLQIFVIVGTHAMKMCVLGIDDPLMVYGDTPRRYRINRINWKNI